MAGEIGVTPSPYLHAPANGVYAEVRNAVNQIWSVTGGAFENYSTAHKTSGNYAITLTEQGTASGVFVGNFPSTITVGIYSITAFIQGGASVAENDPECGNDPKFNWTGTVVSAAEAYLPQAQAGAANGVFIAGTNAATSITTALTANITGNLSGSVGSVTGAVGSVTGAVGSVTAAVILSAGDSPVLQSGTATAGGASTITIQTALGTTADPVGCKIKITSGTGAKQERIITGYVNSTLVVTVDYPWMTNPDATSVYSILYDNAPSLNSALKIAGVVLTDTLTTYTGNTPQTGDSYARIGVAGVGLTNLGDTRIANLDAAVSSRMATYTQPTGFLAATFPSGTVANTTNITAGTITTVTNLTNSPTAGDFTATMKTSLNNSTPASITGAVGSVTGNVGGNVVGSVASVTAAVTLTAGDSPVLQSGTATAGGASTITIQTALGHDSLPVGCVIKITSGTGAKQARTITAYVDATQVVTVDRAWTTNPDATSVYTIGYADEPKLDSSLEVTANNSSAFSVNVTQWAGTNVATPNVAGVPIVDLKYTLGTVSPAAAGSVSVDWAQVVNPTSTVGLTGTTIATTQKVDVNTIKTQTVTCAAGVTVGAFVGNATAAIGVSAGGKITEVVLTDTTTTVTNQLTAAAIATGIWQDATAGDFAVASSIGKSLYTAGVVPGGSGGIFIAGTNAATSITTGLTAHIIGTVDTVTTLTNLPAIPANWLTAAGINAGALNGKGDWVLTSHFDTIIGTPVTSVSADIDAILSTQIRSGTAQAGSGTTITLDSGASATNSFYNNDLIVITGGTGVGQSRFISAYVGATKVATVGIWATNPDVTSKFVILPFDAVAGATAPTVAQIVTGIMQDTTAGNYTVSGSFGKSVFTGVAPGASGGIFISGANIGPMSVSNGVTFDGGGANHGFVCSAIANSRHGFVASAAGTSGNGINAMAGGTFGNGIQVLGQGYGIYVLSNTDGIYVLSSTGNAITAEATANNGSGLNCVGHGSGPGINAIGGATAAGLSITGGATSGDGIDITTTIGHGINIAASGTSTHGLFVTGGTAGVSDGAKFVAGTGGVDFRASPLQQLEGAFTTTSSSIFTVAALANAPGGGGSVTVGGYAAGQDPFTLVMQAANSVEGYTLQQALRLFGAVLCGTSSGGPGGTTFFAMGSGITRVISADSASGDRSLVTLSP